MVQDARTVELAKDIAKAAVPITPLYVSHPTVYPWLTATGNHDFPTVVRAIRAQTAGNVQYKDANDNTVVAKFLAGETRNLVARSIVAAGTTVTDLEGMP